MKTRQELYGREAAELLRVITTYRCLLAEQLSRLFSGREAVAQRLLMHLVRQRRVALDRQTGLCTVAGQDADTSMIAPFWVLLDFIERVEYHTAGEFPVKISFFGEDEAYEIIYVPLESEILAAHALSSQKEPAARRLILIDSPEQIKKIDIENVTAFCTVAQDGSVQYFKLE